jgi:ribosomal protein S18 acetylase RimI-like enzyme
VDPAPLVIRGAEAGDVAALERLEAECFDHDRISRRSFAHHVRAPSSLLLVAGTGETIAGYALGLQRRGTRVMRLFSLAVAVDHRRRGVASALLKAVEGAARRRGAKRLRLEVKADNQPALTLYRQRDYRVFGRIEGYYEDGSDALRLEKLL